MKYIGIDGCKGGWFCVGFEDRNRATWRMERISQLTDISGYLRRAELVLIDIPIGLRSIDPLERRCDV
ncbi:DUF429 domain-containing protein, partial [bacterium]|nr:DUF429 domain-containing protein [candidate division CSSED10-310 bacterium]